MSSKRPRRNKPPVGKQGPIRRRICVVTINMQIYNLRAVIIIHAMTKIVKSFPVGVWGSPFFKRGSPSKSKQVCTYVIACTA